MRTAFLAIVLLMGAFNLNLMAQTQPSAPVGNTAVKGVDLAIVYAPERAKTANTGCDCFWFQGAAADAAFTFYRGLGIAANLTGQHASNLAGAGSVGKIAYLAGPRYTFSIRHGSRLFGEALFGGVHGFDGSFPIASGTKTTANSFAYQLGGGFDLALARGFGLRLVELDYFHSSLPNNGSGTQNDIRLAFGVSYHMGRS
jgi:hypothetical protein